MTRPIQHLDLQLAARVSAAPNVDPVAIRVVISAAEVARLQRQLPDLPDGPYTYVLLSSSIVDGPSWGGSRPAGKALRHIDRAVKELGRAHRKGWR